MNKYLIAILLAICVVGFSVSSVNVWAKTIKNTVELNKIYIPEDINTKVCHGGLVDSADIFWKDVYWTVADGTDGEGPISSRLKRDGILKIIVSTKYTFTSGAGRKGTDDTALIFIEAGTFEYVYKYYNRELTMWLSYPFIFNVVDTGLPLSPLDDYWNKALELHINSKTDNSVNIFGSLIGRKGSVVPDKNIEIKIKSGSSIINSVNTKTDIKGRYNYSFTPLDKGDYEVIASFQVNDTFQDIHKVFSTNKSFNIVKPISILTLNDIMNTTVNDPINIIGSLTDVNGDRLADTPIIVKISRNGMLMHSIVIFTDSDGNYNYSYTPLNAGDYDVTVSSGGAYSDSVMSKSFNCMEGYFMNPAMSDVRHAADYSIITSKFHNINLFNNKKNLQRQCKKTEI